MQDLQYFQGIILIMKSKMLKAFMDQQKFTDEEAITIANSIEDLKNENFNKGMQQLDRSQDIRQYTSIPTQLKPGELDQTHEVHPRFKDYNHSCEQVRMKFTLEGPDAENRQLSEREIQQIDENPFTIDWNSLGDSLNK